MDLEGLRKYIEEQKKRLMAEREALRPPPQIFVSEATSPSRAEDSELALQLPDSFDERINSLNTFKSEVCSRSEQSQCVDHTSLPDNDDVDKQHDDSSCLRDCTNLHPSPVPSLDLKSDETTCSDKKLQEQVVPSETITLPRIAYKENISPARNRDEEVSRLQDKFASVSFWDGFGSSATTKKWSPSSKETMVRVGEFSPSNPDLQAPGKALLGLGEYEERRRQLLDKKKQEYKEYLSQTRTYLQRTDHLHHPTTMRSSMGSSHPQQVITVSIDSPSVGRIDVATQTETLPSLQYQAEPKSNQGIDMIPATLPLGDPVLPLSPRVPRAQSSQVSDTVPDVRMRQLQLQEELRMQIEEKRRLEAERREQERLEEEALQRRVAEQQARLQAEFQREEKLRQDREIQKQQQIEDFQRRQEELKAESEALKQEERRQKLDAAEIERQAQEQLCLAELTKAPKNAHLVPPPEPAPLSILKSNSPPLRSPRHNPPNDIPLSPRALIRVLEGPTISKHGNRFDDSLPIPLMPVAHSHNISQHTQRSPHRSPKGSPNKSPRRSPNRRSPSRFGDDVKWGSTSPVPHHPHQHSSYQRPSEAMRNLEERWKVPAVQKNVCVRGKPNVQSSNSGNVLTQLGAFRRQLQMEHMRMEEKVRVKRKPQQYQQQYYQYHSPQ